MQCRIFGCSVIILGAVVSTAWGQGATTSIQDVMRQMEQMRQRMDSLEKQHEQDQQRIRQLERQVNEMRAKPTVSAKAEPEEVVPPVPYEQLRPLPESAFGQGNLFNPQITAFLDMGGNLSTNNDNEAFNRFNLREAEIDIRSAITPSADGVLVIAIHEHIDEHGHDHGEEEEAEHEVEIQHELDLEEGYINFHTLPFDLALKGGKFRSVFGRNNLLHTHDLPQITRPLAVRAFLGEEGLSTVGGSLSWIVPNPWDMYLELTGEVINAEGGHDSPILGGPEADNPAIALHAKLFQDITDTSSFEIGGSYLYSRTDEDNDFDANVFGLDVTWLWRDPEAPDFRSLLLQGEFFWADNDLNHEELGAFRNDSFGFYAFGQYQFSQNWYGGLRFDYTQFPNSETRGPDDKDWALSPYITWYLTEFLRLRLEYQHREFEMANDWDSEENLFFGVTFSIGSHPPHPYWINR